MAAWAGLDRPAATTASGSRSDTIPSDRQPVSKGTNLDRTGTWFLYHHLLRDLLHLEAEATIAAQHLPQARSRRAVQVARDLQLI
jgi:hypothetical protein